MKRSTLLALLAERILGLTCSHPVRVAIDGVDGVGKTVLADELSDTLSDCGRSIIRASVDGFHNPRSIRYRLGRNSPEGYFQDSFNYAALATALLTPLGPGGTRRYRRSVFDYRTDSQTTRPVETAAQDAILLFDGVFLHRPELVSHWDFSVFLDAPFEVTIPRAALRDDRSADVAAPENRRYVEGQQIYLQTCDPRSRATLVINNKDLTSPTITGPMGIRVATENDIPEIGRVRMSVKENRLDSLSSLRPGDTERMLNGDGRGWVVEVAGRIVGFAIADLSGTNVYALFVEPEHERRGIGLLLHDTMIDWFFSSNVDNVWLSTDPETRAEAFYRKAGWTAVGKETNGEVRFKMSRDGWLSR